ncbi:hypothetical protein QBC41DRAFT_383924, partial [Cercophora samala]
IMASATLRPIGFNSLPAEIRLMIYRATWEPVRVVLRPNVLGRTITYAGSRPITLSINFEARSETLKCYHVFSYLYKHRLDRPKRLLQGWINPLIDTLHIPKRAMQRMQSLQFYTLREPLLRITFEASKAFKDVYRPVINCLRSKCYPELTSFVKTMEFSNLCGRYRLCRTTSEHRLALVQWEDAVFHPAIQYRDEIFGAKLDQKYHSRQDNRPAWAWQYDPSSSRPITNSDPESRSSTISPLDDAYQPNPNVRTTLRLPAAVSHYFDRHAPDHFRQHRVLVFDNNPPSTPCNQEERWSFLRVVPWKGFEYRKIVDLAFDNMFYFNPVDGRHPAPSQDGSFEDAIKLLRPFDSRMVGPHEYEPEPAGREVHGVCTPDFQFPPGEAEQEQEKDEENEEHCFEKNISYFRGRDGQVRRLLGSWRETVEEEEE